MKLKYLMLALFCILSVISLFWALSSPALGNEDQEAGEGSITVCKVIIDQAASVVDGSQVPDVTFTISGINPAQNSGPSPVGTIGTASFTTPLTLNSDLFSGVPGNDAQCETYGNLALGDYYWGEESISPEAGWASPKYNDQHLTLAVTTADFYSYDNNLFDGDSSNDSGRNTNADGHIVLLDTRPDRTLIVLNQYESQGQNTDPSPSPSVTPQPDPSPSPTPDPSPSPSSGPDNSSQNSGSTGGQVLGESTGPTVLADTGEAYSNLIFYLGIIFTAFGVWQILKVVKNQKS